MTIENVTITKPSLLTKLFDGTSHVQTLYNSKINNIKGYSGGVLSLRDGSNVDNVDNYGHVFLEWGTYVNTIKNAKSVNLKLDSLFQSSNYKNLEPPRVNNISSVYLNVGDLSEVKEASSHATFLTTGAIVDNLLTNKLIIRPKTKYNCNDFKNSPVKIDNANIINKKINSENFITDSGDDRLFEEMSEYYKKLNCFADVEFCQINNLTSDKLFAKNAKIENANIKECHEIINSEIKNLRTSNIKIIKNSVIDKFIISTNKLTIKLDKGVKINKIEFEKPNGELVLKNKGDYIPNFEVANGTVVYDLEDISLDKLSVKKDFVAGNGVQIKTLEIKEPDAVVTLIGNAKIENINFINGGKVVLENNTKGIHPNIQNIKINNGQIIKNYPLEGFEKIAGMEELKQELKEDVINPLKEPEKYKKYGLDVINGFLMYGPPGCGKTFIAKQLAEETGRYFVEIKPSNTSSSFIHETAKNIAKKFEEARAHKPSIIFIDEVEAIAPVRDGLGSDGTAVDINEQVTELLQQINNSKTSDVLVVCASNEPQRIDNAIKRTGRLDKKIFIGNPDNITRKEIFKQQLQKVYKDANIDYDLLSKKSEYYTAEDIRMVIRDAALKAMQSDRSISQNDLINSLNKIKPSLSKDIVQQYYLKGEI